MDRQIDEAIFGLVAFRGSRPVGINTQLERTCGPLTAAIIRVEGTIVFIVALAGNKRQPIVTAIVSAVRIDGNIVFTVAHDGSER